MMAQSPTQRPRKVFFPVAVAGAAVIAGIASYSISVVSASTSGPETVAGASVRPSARECNPPRVDLDRSWYRQRDGLTPEDQLLPNTVSFVTPSAGVWPEGKDPCDGGREPSCLSDFGFDPENYWVVFDRPEVWDPTVTDLFVAEADSLEAISDDAIDTLTACDVSISWTSPDGNSVSGLFAFFNAAFSGLGVNVVGSGMDTMELSISGMGSSGMIWGYMYVNVICANTIALEVSDGTNDYYNFPPQCAPYQFNSTLSQVPGISLTYEYKDPWGRTDTATTQVSLDGQVNEDYIGVVAKPQSPVTITFNANGTYTLRTGPDANADCSSLSATTPALNNAVKAATPTWVSADPNLSQLFCTTLAPPV